MKMQWKQVSSITTSQRHLGSHRMQPTENLHPGDVYQNKVTGYTYEWQMVADDKPHFDFSRTPNSGNNDWHSRGELPPVGAMVEIVGDNLMYGQGESGEVIIHVEDTAVVRMSYGLGCFNAKNLRPLKSERERAIEEIIEVVSKSDGTFQSAAEMLYDAGFRKEGK